MDPDCQFGLILKTYFKKESLVGDVFGLYMRDNYFTRAGLDQSSFSLNVAACRLVLDILPGLEDHSETLPVVSVVLHQV